MSIKLNVTNLKNQNIHGFFDAGIIFDLGQNEIIENISCSEFVFFKLVQTDESFVGFVSASSL